MALAPLGFSMDPALGIITPGRKDGVSTGSIGFGEGNNFIYQKKEDRKRLTSDLVNSLRGKIDGDHPEIIIKRPKRKPAFVRFRIRKRKDTPVGNERSELAVGPQFSGNETVHIGFSFRVPRLEGPINTKYILQIWQPVESPRAGVRINTSDSSSYDLVSRSGGGITRSLRKDGKGWNHVIMTINNNEGIIWRNKKGKILARSPGGFLSPSGNSLTWRPKFGAYGYGGNNATIDVRGFSIGSDLDAVIAALV